MHAATVQVRECCEKSAGVYAAGIVGCTRTIKRNARAARVACIHSIRHATNAIACRDARACLWCMCTSSPVPVWRSPVRIRGVCDSAHCADVPKCSERVVDKLVSRPRRHPGRTPSVVPACLLMLVPSAMKIYTQLKPIADIS